MRNANFVIIIAVAVLFGSVPATAADTACSVAVCSYDAAGNQLTNELPVAGAVTMAAHASGILYNKKLVQWTDPFTPPETRTRCIKYASGNWPWPARGGWKTCVGWATDFRTMQISAYLRVTGPTNIQASAQRAVQTCADAAAISAIAAFVGTPSPEIGARAAAAYATIWPVFVGCIKTAGAAIVGVDLLIPTVSAWSSWSGGGG